MRLVQLVDGWWYGRRYRWVEISIARAWSCDMPPRLFDTEGG